MSHPVSLSDETWALVDLWREDTGLGRSAAIEVLVHCALTQGLVLPQAPDVTSAAEAEEEAPEFVEPDLEEATGPEAGAPADAAEATGSSTPASSVGTP